MDRNKKKSSYNFLNDSNKQMKVEFLQIFISYFHLSHNLHMQRKKISKCIFMKNITQVCTVRMLVKKKEKN